MPLRRFLSFRDFDWWLLCLVLALGVISVLEIYSTTVHTRFASFESKQIFFIAAGVVCMFILAKIDYHRLIDLSPWMYGIFIVSLVAVRLVGHKALGARRWIALGPIQFQPSEWVKLVLILAMARYIANIGGRNLTWKEIFKAFGMVCVPMILVLIQPDLGTTLTYAPVLVAGLFFGGINLKQAAILVTCGAAMLVGVLSSGIVQKLQKSGVVHSYQQSRLTSFINPQNDPKGAGYQLSLIHI